MKIQENKKYNGRIIIIPCCDLYEYEHDKETDYIEGFVTSFKENRLISTIKFNADKITEYSKELTDDEFFKDVFLDYFRKGYLVRLETPIPEKINMVNDKITDFVTYGYWRAAEFYIYIEDLNYLNDYVYQVEQQYYSNIYDIEQENKG